MERSSPLRVEKAVSHDQRQVSGKARLFIGSNLGGYLFLLPALGIFALFVWYPLVLGFVMSFQSVDMINPAAWVGWTNYQKVLSDPLFAVALSMQANPGVYALLLGSGVSRSAGMPTGWEVVLDLLRRLAAVAGEESV